MKAVSVFVVAFVFLLLLPLHWPPRADAYHYLHASQALLEGRGLLMGENVRGLIYMTDWPPLQSMIFAGLRLTGVDLQAGIHGFNALWYGLTVMLTWHMLGQRRWLVLALFTPVFTASFLFALSEPAFIALSTLFLWMLLRPRLYLLALALTAALLVLLRYSGIVPVGIGFIVIACRWGWRAASVYGLLPIVTLSGWVLRNLALVGTPLGQTRDMPQHRWGDNLTEAASTLLVWLLMVGLAWIIERPFTWLIARRMWR